MTAPLNPGQAIVSGILYHIDNNNLHSSIPVVELFAGRRLLVFMGPAPFSKLDTQQALEYETLSNELLALGIDEVIGIYVQDAFVTKKFQDQTHEAAGSRNVKLYADGDGFFVRGNNLVHDFTYSGLGQRSGRWAMILNDGVVEYVIADDYQLVEFTKADSILKYLKNET